MKGNMSALVIPPNSKNIHVDVPIPGRKPARISTRTSNREAAKVIGGSLELFAKKHTGKKVTKVTVMETAQMLARTVNTDCLEVNDISVVLPALAKETALANGNAFAKDMVVTRFLVFMKERDQDHIDIWEVTTRQISEFFAWAREKYNFGDSTHRMYGHTLGGLFAAAKKHKMVAENVVRDVALPKRIGRSPRRGFTQEELRAVYTVADEEWRGIIMVGACTGMRLGDIVTLVARDVNFETGLSVRFPKRWTGSSRSLCPRFI